MGKYIDGSGLSHFMGIIKGALALKANTTDVPIGSSTTPAMNGTAAAGTETKWAHGDHVHPTDTSRAPKNHATTDTTYGAGTSSNYGHVKLSDATNGTAAAASGGTAATPKAVADALTAVSNGYLPNTVNVDGVGFVSGAANRYVTCSTSASTATKEITVNGCKGLSAVPTGLVVYVEFSATNTAAVANLAFQLKAPPASGSGTVNVGSAAPIKYRGANLSSAGILAENRIYPFVFDGTNWELMGDLDTNTQVAKTTTTPKMNGTAAIGSETKYAAGDHVHPTDTSRAASDHVHGNITNGGDITATAPTIASGDKLIINDESESKITNGPAFGTSTSTYLRNDGSWNTPTDTKNTAGSTDASDKLFLIGAKTQAANPQTYSQATAFVGTDGHLYSNSLQVVNLSGSQALTNKTYNGYTLAAACAKAVVTSLDTSASLPTSNAVKTYVDNAIASGAMFQGTLGTGTATSTHWTDASIQAASYKKGWYWVVDTAGTYLGLTLEVGDMVFCVSNKGSAYAAADFSAIQSNIEVLSNGEIDTLWNNATAA